MLVRYLDLEGFECATAGNCDLALADIARRRPDAVILDCGMPGIASDDACRRLRADAATRELPVLLFAPTEAEEAAAIDAGATAVLPKPFHLATVAATLRQLFPDAPAPRG